MRRAAVLIAVATATLGCGPRGGQELAAWRRAADDAEAPLEAAIRRFDAAAGRGDRAAALAGAREAAAAGREARERIASLSGASALAGSQREELVYLNHVIPGFERFARSDAGADAVAELRSILGRGRAHQRAARSPAD
jgi:hypothetical protein